MATTAGIPADLADSLVDVARQATARALSPARVEAAKARARADAAAVVRARLMKTAVTHRDPVERAAALLTLDRLEEPA